MPSDTPEVETCVAQTKRWRRDLDAILQEMKPYSGLLSSDIPCAAITTLDELEARREAQHRLIEAIMWCGMIMKALNASQPGTAPNPYPESYNPASPVVEPVADGLKL